MPFKPVISINVDDEQFRDFVKIFDQYQSKLKDTDSEWSRAARTMNHGFGDRAGSKLHDMADTLSGMNPSIRGIGGGIIALSRHMGVFGGAVSVAAAGVGLIGRGIKAALGDAIKLSLALAGGVSAFDRLAQGTVNRTNAARMLGTTTARASAFRSVSNAFGFNPNLPNSVSTGINPETFGTVQTLQPLTGMTPDQMQRHTIRASQALRLAAHNWFQKERHESVAWFQSQPIFQAFRDVGIGLQQGQQLANTPLQTILAMRQQFRSTAAVGQLQPGAARDMATFRAQLGRAGIALETDLANHLHALGPHLGAFVDAVERDAATLINGVLTPANLKAVSGALDSFTKWATSGGGRAAVKQFADALKTDVPKIASALGTLAVEFGNIAKLLAPLFGDTSKAPKGSFASTFGPHGETGAQYLGINKWFDHIFGVRVSRVPNMVNFHDPKIAALMHNANTALGIPHFMQNIAMQESSGNANAVNKTSGAEGLFQDQPSIARRLHFNPFDPMQAITGNLRLALSNAHALGGQYTKADPVDRMDLLAAAHDMGVTELRAELTRYGSLGAAMPHLPRETQAYIGSVNRREGDWARSAARLPRSSADDSSTLKAIAHNTRKPATRVVYAPQTPTQSDIAFQLFTASMGAQQ